MIDLRKLASRIATTEGLAPAEKHILEDVAVRAMKGDSLDLGALLVSARAPGQRGTKISGAVIELLTAAKASLDGDDSYADGAAIDDEEGAGPADIVAHAAATYGVEDAADLATLRTFAMLPDAAFAREFAKVDAYHGGKPVEKAKLMISAARALAAEEAAAPVAPAKKESAAE